MPQDTLKSRIAPGTPRTDQLRSIVNNIFGLSSRLSKERSSLSVDKDLSLEGRRKQEAEFAKTLMKPLSELTRPLRLAKGEIAAKRAYTKLSPAMQSLFNLNVKNASKSAEIAQALQNNVMATASQDRSQTTIAE
jgi:hypothetical protein